MTEAELQAILAKQNEAVATLVKSAVTEAVAALAPKAEGKEEGKTEDKTEKKEAPKFTGDANDPIALEAYGVELQTFELQTKIDSGDITAEEIISMSKSMSKSMSESGPSNDELNEAGIETNDDDNAEVKALQVQLFKARKGSNAPERSEAKDVVADLAKASEDEGLEISKILNESLGNSSGIANSMQVVRS